jgi:hypothetical protein
MPRHLTEMRDYMRLAESMYEDTTPVAPVEPPPIVVVQEDRAEELLQELADLQFKLESYTELNEDQQYAMGVEQGYVRAADMLGRLLQKYSSPGM